MTARSLFGIIIMFLDRLFVLDPKFTEDLIPVRVREAKSFMTLLKPVKVLFLLWLGSEATYIVWLGLKKFMKRNDRSSEDAAETPANTVLFFDSKSPACFFKEHNVDKCERKNCPKRNMRSMKKLIENAKTSVDVCMYKLSSSFLRKYLQKAIRNGAKVRVFVHGTIDDHSKDVLILQQSGAFVRGREYENCLLMHHKFVVIDNTYLITGSLNWTMKAISGNWEDAAIMLEPSIIQKFTDEFNYLWDNFNISINNWPTPVNPKVFPRNLSVWKETSFHEVFMFREDTFACRAHMSPLNFDKQPPGHEPVCAYPILRNLAELLSTAEKSIGVCQLLINLESVADVFLDAAFRGLEVRVVTDGHMASSIGSQVKNLMTNGIEVRGKHYHSNLHHKFIILDKKFVIFGSFNWTLQALCGNAESLVCTNNNDIVNKFCEHFDDLWNDLKPINMDTIGLRSFR